MDDPKQKIPFIPLSREEGSSLPQYLTTISGTLCAFCAGSVIAWSSPAVPMLFRGDCGFPLDREQASWISSLLAAGALLGAIPAGPLGNLLGRKKAIILQGVLFLVSWLMILFAKSSYILCAARFVGGIAVGGSTSLLPLYTSEIAEERIKGKLCSYTQLMIVSGVLYTYVLGAFLSYKMLAIFCALVPAMFLVVFLFPPESPVYLLLKGKDKEAERALQTLRGQGYDVTDELRTLKCQIDNVDPAKNNSFAFLRKSTFKAGFICLSLMAFQQLSGINIIIFNCTAIFASVGSGIDASYATIAVGLVQVMATFFASGLLSNIGRRALLFTSAFTMALSLLALGTYFDLKSELSTKLSIVPLFLVFIYIVAFSFGFGPVPFVMLGELLPCEIKGFVSGLSVAVNWGTTFAVVKTYDLLIDSMGPDKTFWLYGIFCLVISLFVIAFVLETKGKRFETIQYELEYGESFPSGYQRI